MSPSAGAVGRSYRRPLPIVTEALHAPMPSPAAGISSTGDPVLDARLPLHEPYHIPESTVRAIRRFEWWMRS